MTVASQNLGWFYIVRFPIANNGLHYTVLENPPNYARCSA